MVFSLLNMFKSNWVAKLKDKAKTIVSSCELIQPLNVSQPFSLCYKSNSKEKINNFVQLQRAYKQNNNNHGNYQYCPLTIQYIICENI